MDPDLIDLLAAWFGDDEPGPDRAAALLARLEGDGAFRAAFVAEIRMLGMLRAAQSPESRWLRLEDELGWSAAAAPAERTLEDRVVGRIHAAATADGAATAGRGGRRGRPAAWASGLAAAGLVAAALATRPWWGAPGSAPATAPPAPAVTAAPRAYPRVDTLAGLAMAVKLDGVRWAVADEPHPAEGDVLAPGRLRFDAGRARVSMLTGVVLDVEGPADLDLIDADKVFCHRGRVRVRVPAGAEGFQVLGPGAAIVDLGTEFGVNVEPDGTMRGRIFRGKLEAALLDESGTAQRSYLLDAGRAGSSRAFAVDARSHRIEAVPPGGDYVEASSPVDPPLPLGDAYRAAVLRADPWGYWRFESLPEGMALNEVEGRPALRTFGATRLAGEPDTNRCVEFPAGDPGQYLALAEPWRPTWASGFAVELWALSESIAHASLVGMTSPADTDNHLFLLELTARNRLTIDRPASIRLLHRFPAGWEGGDNTYSDRPYVPFRWHHVVGQLKGDAIELFVDGVLSSRLPVAADHADIACQLILGRLTTLPGAGVSVDRPFVGRLDEVALYDHALTPEQVREHHALGAPPRPAR